MNISNIDITKTCLTCLKEDINMKSIFSLTLLQNTSFADMIRICTFTKIKNSENKLPTQICFQCIKDLQLSYTFKIQCEKAYETLSKILLIKDCFPIIEFDENEKCTQTNESELIDFNYQYNNNINLNEDDLEINDHIFSSNLEDNDLIECKSEEFCDTNSFNPNFEENLNIENNEDEFAESEASNNNDSDEDYVPTTKKVKSLEKRMIGKRKSNKTENISNVNEISLNIPQQNDTMDLLMILKSWNLEELDKILTENGVTHRSLKYLNFDDIKDVLPNNKIGLRAEFREKLLKWQKLEKNKPMKEQQQIQSSQSQNLLPTMAITAKQITVPPLSTLQKLPLHVSSAAKQLILPRLSKVQKSNQQIRLTNMMEQKKNDDIERELDRCSSNSKQSEINLINILQSTTKGKMILTYYKHNKKINSVCRSKLVEVIAEEYLRKRKTMNNNLFVLITKEICNIFPQENKDTYYIPRTGTMQAKGKLWHKYNNCLRSMRRLGIINNSKYSKRKDFEETDAEFEDDALISADKYRKIKDWLYIKREPFSDIIEKWKLTSVNRLNDIKIDNLTPKQILENWPLYNYRYGEELIEADFETLDKKNCMNLMKKWDSISEKIIALGRLQIKDKNTKKIMQDMDLNIDTITKDCKNCYVLNILCALLTPKRSVKTKNNEIYRSKITNVQNNIMLHIKNPSEYKKILEEYRNRYDSLGFPQHPIIIMIGEDYNSLTDFKVYYDNLTYSNFKSFIKALDICFKIHFIFNIKFSCESELVWQFFQKHIYGTSIKTNHFTHNASILSEFITDLEAM